MSKIRLQFKHHLEPFATRDEAVEYINSLLIDDGTGAVLDGSKMGEPIVVSYKDENDNLHAILAIGKKDGGTNEPYQIIDYDYLGTEIDNLSKDIEAEKERATKAEDALDAAIKAEVTRATNKESSINSDLGVEREERKNRDTALEGLVGELSASTENIKDGISTLNEEAIKYISINGIAYTIASNQASVELGANSIKLTDYIAPDAEVEDALLAETIKATDTVNDGIKKLDYRIGKEILRSEEADKSIEERISTVESMSIAKKDLAPIIVDKVDNGYELGLNVEDGDKQILSVKNNVLSSTLSIQLIEKDDKKYLQLIGVDDKVVSELDAAAFIVDGMLKDIEVNERNGVKYIDFIWNTDAGDKKTSIALAEFLTPYVASDGIQIDESHNVSIKLNKEENTDGAKYLTLGSNGLGLTGISTDIQTAVSEVKTELSTSINTLSTNADALAEKVGKNESNISKNTESITALTSDLAAYKVENAGALSTLTSDVDGKLSTLDAKLDGKVETLSQTIETSASDIAKEIANVSGAVNTYIADYDDYFVTKSITTVTVDDAQNQTLLYKIASVDGSKPEIYASNNTKDMIHSGSTLSTVLNNLIDKVAELEKKNTELEAKIAELESNMITLDKISGVESEIKVDKTDGNVVIGFADDAVFGPLTV